MARINLGLPTNPVFQTVRTITLTLSGGGTLTGASGAITLSSSGATALIFKLNSVEKARFAPTTGNLLLGGLTTDGTGVLQFPAGAADATSGITFGTDTQLWRIAAGRFIFKNTGATSTTALYLRDAADGTGNIVYRSGAANSLMSGDAAGDTGIIGTRVVFGTAGGTLALTLDASQNATFAAKIQSYGSANNRAEIKKILYGATTDAATAVELTTDGAAGSGATNRITVPADTALSVVLNIAVKQSASANAKQMLRQFVISNNGGTVAIQGTVVTLGTDSGTAGLTTVTCTVTANDTDDAIKIEVNGVAATNLRYTAYLVSTEVLYA